MDHVEDDDEREPEPELTGPHSSESSYWYYEYCRARDSWLVERNSAARWRGAAYIGLIVSLFLTVLYGMERWWS